MKAAIGETTRRRAIQREYNRTHDITPTQIKKEIRNTLFDAPAPEKEYASNRPTGAILKELEREMKKSVKELNFERAAQLRDRINALKRKNE